MIPKCYWASRSQRHPTCSTGIPESKTSLRFFFCSTNRHFQYIFHFAFFFITTMLKFQYVLFLIFFSKEGTFIWTVKRNNWKSVWSKTNHRWKNKHFWKNHNKCQGWSNAEKIFVMITFKGYEKILTVPLVAFDEECVTGRTHQITRTHYVTYICNN